MISLELNVLSIISQVRVANWDDRQSGAYRETQARRVGALVSPGIFQF
jgi:hypothetical protein